jgi:hypothetical protein
MIANGKVKRIFNFRETKMFQMTFTKSFASEAYTLDPDEVRGGGGFDSETGTSTRTHADGWTVWGRVHEDYYEWVNEFEAHHPSFGRVWGDFESEVFADSEAAYDAFFKHHAPTQWDYHDI